MDGYATVDKNSRGSMNYRDLPQNSGKKEAALLQFGLLLATHAGL